MIVLKNITKNYHLSKTNEVHVLGGVSIAFRKSEFVSVLGPSGCGKTTLLNIIGGLDVCDSGEIVVGGVSTANFSASDWDNYRNKRIGFVFQSYNLIPHLNAVRNVEMPLVLAGIKKSEARKKAIEMLDKVGLKDQIYKKPLQLSGGQMQRVALARALVADPDIILADEPTGALDAESSVQVMDLLREVSRDRLVVMVTHNNMLAEEYSSRIINLSGGVISGDSNPYSIEEAEKVETLLREDTLAPETLRAACAENATESSSAPVKKARAKKSHLSFSTATELSARTLIGKKIRTALTSFAGSIGIIGIILVLAFSTGVNAYISNLEEGALSLYPLSIEQTSLSLTSILSKLTGGNNSDRESFPNSDTIYTNKVLGNVVSELTAGLSQRNDLVSFKKHLDNTFDNSLGYVKYEYNVPLHVYAVDSKDSSMYMKTEPFLDVMDKALNGLGLAGNSAIESVKPYAQSMSAWDEMVDNREFLYSQYDLVGKQSRWPKTEVYKDENGQMTAEVVIVTDEKNQINDYSLFMLGLKSESEVKDVIFGQKDFFSNANFKVSELLKLEYFVLGGFDFFNYNEEDGVWEQTDKTIQEATYIDAHTSVKAKVVGVIRPKKGATGMTINGAIGYDSSLTRYLIEKANNHPAVKAQLAGNRYSKKDGSLLGSRDILKKGDIEISGTSYANRMYDLGVADLSQPTAIYIYSHSFEGKEKILSYIEDYNLENPDNDIKYTDLLGSVMSFVNTMSDAVSKVLIGFTSISLIVSSIMIAVIIYTSVLERRKEVGILRSIGARKRDITTIFMAESGILGLFSGILGVLIGWIITLPVNAILLSKVGIPNLALVLWWHPVLMVAISFLLSVTAGVIPAFMGAKQDPAVALRTE